MLCTLVDPTSGTATVAGHDIRRERGAVRRNIGLVFQDPTLDQYLTAEQNLRMQAELYGVRRPALEERKSPVLDMVDLSDRQKSLVSTYSGGMKGRLDVAPGAPDPPKEPL